MLKDCGGVLLCLCPPFFEYPPADADELAQVFVTDTRVEGENSADGVEGFKIGSQIRYHKPGVVAGTP